MIFFLTTYNEDPYFNMACDEWLLYKTENNQINGFLRFFTWKDSPISIGCYQRTTFFDNKKIIDNNVKIVRRITGGNAILHKGDFSYSIIIKKGLYELHGKKDFYLFISKILQKSLNDMNIQNIICLKPEIGENKSDCFNSISEFEIISINNAKLIGSAQKILNKSMIQEGSFFNKYDPSNIKYFTNEFGYIEKSVTEPPKYKISEIEMNFQKYFRAFFSLQSYTLTEDDYAGIKLLVDKKYSKDLWNYRK